MIYEHRDLERFRGGPAPFVAGDIIRGVNLLGLEVNKKDNKIVYIFRLPQFEDTKGLAYPSDALVSLGSNYDVWVSRLLIKPTKLGRSLTLIYSGIYQDISLGTRIPVVISRMGNRGDGVFNMTPNIFGYVPGTRVGDMVRVEVTRFWGSDQRARNCNCRLVERLGP